MPELYAQGINEMIARGFTPKDVTSRLVGRLRAEGRLGLMPGILRAIKRAQEGARHQNVLSVASEKDIAQAQKDIPKCAQAPRVVVDPTLIGGWRLRTRDTLRDSSYKKHLQTLYKQITTA